MAQPFQSGSPYGGPYPTGSYYPSYQQFSAQPPSSTPPFAQPSTRPAGPYQSSPNLNLGRFEANSQAPAPNQNFSFPTAPFTPEIFKHFANASIPPPPPPNFPHVAIPNLGFPQFTQNLTPANAVPFQPAGGVPAAPESQDAYDPRFPQQLVYNSRISSSFPAVHNIATEGQRKDEGSATSRTVSQDEQPQEQVDLYGKARYPLNFDGVVFPTLGLSTEPSSDGAVLNQPQKESDALQRVHQGQIQHPQVTSQQVAAHGNDPALPSSQQPCQTISQAMSFSPAGVPASNPKVVLRSYDNKTQSGLRRLAKGALLSLAPHSIHYAELVKEGIDPSVLRQLYDELGIKIEIQHQASRLQSTAVLHDKRSEPENGSGQLQSNRASATAATSVQDELPQIAIPTTDSTPSGTARPPPAVSPGLERKDRIAQLLAAKTGRPSPVHGFSESGASMGASEVRREHENLAGSSDGSHEDSTQETMVESKSAGLLQAEALKQKMDKVRTEALPNAQLERRSTDGATPISINALGEQPLQISIQSSERNVGHSSPLSAIPGLFMTSAVPTQSEVALMDNVWEQAATSAASRTSQKRTLEPDIQQPDLERSAKRQNINTDAMEIDESAEENDASEGEIVDSVDEYRAPTNKKLGHQAPAAPDNTFTQPRVTSTVSNGTLTAQNGGVQSNPFMNQARTRLTSAQIAEKAEMLKARFLKQRAERQKALQEGLPNLDAEVQKTRSRLSQQQGQLSQLRAQIGKLDNELQEARSQEKALLEEVAHLERQLQEGVSGQKLYTDELSTLNTEQNLSEQASTPASTETATKPLPAVVTEAKLPGSGDDKHSDRETGVASDLHSRSGKTSEGDASPSSGKVVDLPKEPSVDCDADDPNFECDEGYNDSPMAGNGVQDDTARDDENNSLVAVDEPIEPSSAVSPDEEAGYSDAEEAVAYDDGDAQVRYYSDGSASMSDSGSDREEEDEGEAEYEPEDVEAVQEMDVDDFDEGEYDPEEMRVEELPPAQQHVEDGDGGYYELASGEPLAHQHTPSSQMSEEMVDSPPAETADLPVSGPAEETSAAAELSPEEGAIEETDEVPPVNVDLSAASNELTTPAQSQAPEDIATPAPSAALQQDPLTDSTRINGTSHAYHPYTSPLSSFQSFRYNEQFNNAVPKEGFRSLTYSNNIDPNVPLCPTELAGEVCEDPNCEEQHFRHLGLSDDKILVSLSSAQDIDKSQRDSYLKGLKKVIAGLREEGVKEFEDVANALSAYRRKFFKDLEGL